jgi:hypothetical protein
VIKNSQTLAFFIIIKCVFALATCGNGSWFVISHLLRLFAYPINRYRCFLPKVLLKIGKGTARNVVIGTYKTQDAA